MLVKFRNGSFITFSTHKIESDRAGAQELSEDAENSWAWLSTAQINSIKPHSSGSGSASSISGGRGGRGRRCSETRHTQEQNISAQ